MPTAGLKLTKAAARPGAVARAGADAVDTACTSRTSSRTGLATSLTMSWPSTVQPAALGLMAAASKLIDGQRPVSRNFAPRRSASRRRWPVSMPRTSSSARMRAGCPWLSMVTSALLTGRRPVTVRSPKFLTVKVTVNAAPSAIHRPGRAPTVNPRPR